MKSLSSIPHISFRCSSFTAKALIQQEVVFSALTFLLYPDLDSAPPYPLFNFLWFLEGGDFLVKLRELLNQIYWTLESLSEPLWLPSSSAVIFKSYNVHSRESSGHYWDWSWNSRSIWPLQSTLIPFTSSSNQSPRTLFVQGRNQLWSVVSWRCIFPDFVLWNMTAVTFIRPLLVLLRSVCVLPPFTSSVSSKCTCRKCCRH